MLFDLLLFFTILFFSLGFYFVLFGNLTKDFKYVHIGSLLLIIFLITLVIGFSILFEIKGV
jgi:hypothetical protein